MKIHEAAPPLDLTPWVVRIVERLDDAPVSMALELPLPFPSLQFLLGDGYGLRALGSTEIFESVPRAGLWGATGSTWQGRHDGRMHAFVVVLTLRGAAAIARDAPRAFAGQRVTLDAVLPSRSRIGARLEEAACFAERLDILSAWLRGLSLRSDGPEAATLAIADRILHGELKGPTTAFAELAGVCSRTLRKQFEQRVGQSPKQLLRVARLQRALKQLHPKPWGGASGSNQSDARLEYFDDSHFARDFKMLTSISPQAYRQSKLRSGDPLVNTVY
jgi:AraC-like DNA-binding protein